MTVVTISSLLAFSATAWSYNLNSDSQISNGQIGDHHLSAILNTYNDRIFSYTGDLTLIEASSNQVDKGWFLIRPNKVLDINGAFISKAYQSSGYQQPDIVLGGTGLSVPATEEAQGEALSLSVLAVSDKIEFMGLNNFDAFGYGLVSTPSVLLDAVESIVNPNAGNGVDFGYERPQETFLVFQNQEGNALYSVENPEGAQIHEGVYVDTTKLKFTAKNGTLIQTYKDFQVNLGDQDFVLDASTIHATDGAFNLTKSGTATMEVSGGSKIITPHFNIANGAQVNVLEGSSAVFGTVAEASEGAALTIGGEGFTFGSTTTDSVGSNGLVNVAGTVSFNGGAINFAGDSDNTESAGITTTTGGMIGFADLISLRNASLAASGDIKLSNTTLVLVSDSKGGSGNGNNVPSLITNGSWSILKATGNIELSDSQLNTSSTTSLYSEQGAILLDADTTLKHTTQWDTPAPSAIFYAKNDITLLSHDNQINGFFHAISTDGDIKIFGDQIRIKPDGILDHILLLTAREGNITLATFKNSEEDSSVGSLEIATRGHGMSTSNVIAKAGGFIRIHGDAGVTLSEAEVYFDGESIEDNAKDLVKISAKEGTISLASAFTISTGAETGVGYGTINIFGQSVSTDEENNLVEGNNYTDVAVTMGGGLYANTINIGQGIGQSQVTVLGTINAIDNTIADKGYSLNLIAGSSGLELSGATIAYGDVDGGNTLLESKGGSISLTGAKIHDNGSDGLGSATDETADTNQAAGTLTIKLTEASDTQAILAEAERIISIASTTINDDIIEINAAEGKVEISKSSSIVADGAPDVAGDNKGLAVTGGSVSLADGSHLGSVGEDGRTTGAEVNVQTSSLALDGTSYITSVGAVSVDALADGNELNIVMDANGVATTGNSWIKGGSVSIGQNRNNVTNMTISGGEISATGGEAGTAGAINIGLGSTNTISGTQIGTGTETINVSGNGNLTLGTVEDEAGNPVGSGASINGASVNVNVGENGSLSVVGTNNADNDANSHITSVGDIVLSGGNIDLTDAGWVKGDGKVTVDSSSLALGNGSHIGAVTEDGQDEGGEVEISANTVNVAEDSFITSTGAVSVSGKDPTKDLNITLSGSDQGGDVGWIKGDSVTIGSPDQSGNVSVTGGQISSTGSADTDRDGIKVEVGSDGKFNLAGTQLDSANNVSIIGNGELSGSQIAADNGVNFGGSTTDPKDSHIVNVTGGSTISGNGMSVAGDTTVNMGGADGSSSDNAINIADGGKVDVAGELNIGGGNNLKGNGDLTVDGDGTVNVAGGKVEAEGDVKIDGGDINLSDNGSIETDGTMTIGGSEDGKASINVAAGETGTIVVGNQNDGGNNLVIGNNGTLNVGNDGLGENGDPINEGSLLVTDKTDSTQHPKPLPGGVMIDKGTNVAVTDGGYVASDNITFNEEGEGDNGKLDIGQGGSLYTDADTILNHVNSDGSGNITIAGADTTVQISGTVSQEKGEDGTSAFDKIQDALGDGTTVIFDQIDGFDEGTIISKEELENEYNNSVIGDAVIDVSDAGDNTLSQGGGGSIMVDVTDGKGSLTIKPNDSGKDVTITGSEADPTKEIVVGAGEDANGDGHPDPVTEGSYDIALEDGSDLTLGKDGAAGGTLSGNITATTSSGNDHQSSDVTVNGGNFTVEGGIDLTHQNNGETGFENATDDGNIIIRDHNTTNQTAQNGLTVNGDVAAGNLEMGGGDTNFDVGGDLTLSGGASLTGNADVDVAGDININEVLDMSGTASLGQDQAASDAADKDNLGNLAVGGLDISDSAAVDRNEVAVNGNAHINGTGGLTADGAFDVKGNLQVGTGVDYNGESTEAGNPAVDVTGDINVDGKATIAGGSVTTDGHLSAGNGLVVGNEAGEGSAQIAAGTGLNVTGNTQIWGNGSAQVTGNAGLTGSLDIATGGLFDVTGDLTVGTTDEEDSANIAGDLSYGGNGTFNNGLTIADGGSVTGSTASDAKTEVNGDLVIGEVNDKVEGGSLVTGGSLDVIGSATINEGDLSAGSISVSGNNDLVVGNEANEGSAHVSSSGDLTVESGKTQIWANGSVEVTEDALLSGGLSVDGGSLVAGGKLEVSGGPTEIVSGTVTATKSNISDDLTVGSDQAEEGEEAIFNAGNAPQFAGNVMVEGNGQLNFTGNVAFGDENADKNFIVKPNGSVNEGIDLPDGTSITVNGDFGLGDNGYVNAGDNFTLGGHFVDPSTGYELTGKVTIGGFIEADKGIDFGDHSVIFTGKDAEGNALVAGTNSHLIAGNVTYIDGAKHVFEKLEGHDDAGEVDGIVTIGVGGTLTTSPDFVGVSDKANLFVDGTISLVDNESAVVIGDIGDTALPQPGIVFGSGAAMTIDGTNFVDGNSLFAAENGNATNIVVGGLQDGEKVSISMDNMSLANGESLVFGNMDEATALQFEFDSNNILQDYFLNVTDGTGYLGMNVKDSSEFGVEGQVSGVVSAVLGNKNENDRKQDLINEVFTQGAIGADGLPTDTRWLSVTEDADGNPVFTVTADGQQRIQDVLSLPIAAGAFNVAYDAMSEMNQSLATRMAEPIASHAISVWADVIATYNSADELFGNSGYSADLYAGVLGADVGITDSWVAGLAVTVGTGDADGEGDTMNIQNDADYYGVSLYTVKDLGQLRISGDVGFMRLENDISTSVNYGGKGDTDVITVGARMDMTVYDGENFSVTPHVGLRYANFSIDTINATATSDINVVEAPLGVTVKGKTEVNGWKVAPMVDVSMVPQFGDKKAKIWNSGVAFEQDVLDAALMKTSVGVSAQKGNLTFGLNYRLGVGGEERQNHSLNANIRYQF